MGENKKCFKCELGIKIKNERAFNNFPGMTFNHVSHIRPHGANSSDSRPLPESYVITVLETDDTKTIKEYIEEHTFTKQCFWLNDSYILDIIKK